MSATSPRPPPPGGPPPLGSNAPSSAAKRRNKSFDVSQLPSLKDGISPKEEADKRRRTCRFLEEAGRILKLPRVAVATAMVFFHRFYAKHSFAQHDRFEVAAACLLLAAKTEESPKKLNAVIGECHKLKTRGAAGRSPGPGMNNGSKGMSGTLDPKSEEFAKVKERVLLLERVILHTIGFELSIDHPYKFLVEQIKRLTQTRQIEYITPPANAPPSQIMEKMTNNLVQYAMNFTNDSMHTSLCLQFPAKTIAAACVYLAGQFAKVRPVGGKEWLGVLDCHDVEAIASICLQIMEMVEEKKGSHSEAFKGIRVELEKIRQENTGGDAIPERDAKRPRV